MDIFLAISFATLLSGNHLGQCVNGSDPSCVTGVANFDALRRHLIPEDAATLVFPFLDQKSSFVARHPLSYSVNRLVLQEIFHYELYSGFVSLTLHDPELFDPRPMQTKAFPFLHSDVGLPATSLWNLYQEQIHYDAKTHIALISHLQSGSHLHLDPIQVTNMLLDEIAIQNVERGCLPEQNTAELKFDTYLDVLAVDSNGTSGNNNTADGSSLASFCWIPVVVVAGFVNGPEFLDQIPNHPNAPAAIILSPNSKALFLPQYVSPVQLDNHQKTWVCSIVSNGSNELNRYTHFHMEIDDSAPTIRNFQVDDRSLSSLPQEWKDGLYHEQISKINQLQQEIIQDNPVVGYTTQVEDYFGNNRFLCLTGECSVGNLFTDALRWKTGAQISILATLLFQGSGWPAGPVRENEIWNAVDMPHTLCSGKVSGLTLFRLFNYSTSVNTFDETAFSQEDGAFLQVSGMRYTYNSQLQGSRLISMEVWDEETQTFEPVERLKTYTLTTTTWICQQRQPFASMVSAASLTLPGEEPFRQSSMVQHSVVTEHLSATTSPQTPLDLSLSGRIQEDISTSIPLNFIQEPDSCEPGTTWIELKQSCQQCPDIASQVQWNREILELEAISGSTSGIGDNLTVSLLNGAPFSIAVSPRSIPPWLVNLTSLVEHVDLESMENSQTGATSQDLVFLSTGDRLILRFAVSAVDLEPGTAVSSLSYGVADGGDYPGCDQSDASFEVTLSVVPEDDLNQLGSIRYAGWVLSFLVLVSAAFCGSTVVWRRKHKLVRFMQPTFLVLICIGVAIMAISMVTLSFDDEIVSTDAMNGFCMTTPWLLSIGFSVTFSALFSKLWRVNHLFNSGSSLRRTKVEAKDAALPFAVICFTNIIILLLWSVIDPLQWVRKMIDDKKWNTYGTCQSDNSFGQACAILVILLNFFALLAACHQAYKARELNSEFSESKNIGIALYSWLQLLVVSVPVLFVTTDDNVEARYFLQVGIIFAVCMTMLTCLFAPLLTRKEGCDPQEDRRMPSGVGHRGSYGSGQVHISMGEGSLLNMGTGSLLNLRRSQNSTEVNRLSSQLEEEGPQTGSTKQGSDPEMAIENRPKEDQEPRSHTERREATTEVERAPPDEIDDKEEEIVFTREESGFDDSMDKVEET